jgi:hypothetical protein
MWLERFGARVAIIALPYLFVVTFVFGRFAPEWGPRWFAANDLILTSGVLPFMAGFGLLCVGLARRLSPISGRMMCGVIGVLSLWVAAFSVSALPTELADVFGAPETRTIDALGELSTRNSNPPTIRGTDGSSYTWMSAFGLYAYPPVASGTYELTLTSASHRIIAIRAVR